MSEHEQNAADALQNNSNELTTNTAEPPPSPPHTANSESSLPATATAAVVKVQEDDTVITDNNDGAEDESEAKDNSSNNVEPKVVSVATTHSPDNDRLPDQPPAPEPIATKPLPSPPSASRSTPRIQARTNTLLPREQEVADQAMMEGMDALFNNRFSVAKAIFESRAREDPLYSLGKGAMAFIRAIISSTQFDADRAIDELSETYEFANAQVEAAQAKKPLKDTVSQIFTNLLGKNTTGLPTNTRPLNQEELKEQSGFMSNGALRAHVIKAECGLLMSLVWLSQETVLGYLKMGLNLRRAYSSYSLVWQEYKRMGQDFSQHMDANTIAAVQFGIGSVHLVLSSLPPKILKVISAFGWHADRNLGFALLKLCLESKTIRSPLASMMLLTYYVLLTSHAPLILNSELMQPAVDCLMDAQKTYPNSAFFLYFAGRVSRLSRSISLSTQSFEYARRVSQGDWAEAPMTTLTGYETAFNHAMQLNWKAAAEHLDQLTSSHSRPSFVKFFYAACMEMAGDRSEAVLAFAEAAQLAKKNKNPTQLDQLVIERVSFYENSGYQDLDLSLPALEVLLLWNSLACMSHECLSECMEKVDEALSLIYERERQEYQIRTTEIAPNVDPPDYYCERGTLLLIKISILNAMGRSHDAIVHLNWIIDNRSRIVGAKWIVPFTYWEAGVASWSMEDKRSVALAMWQQALSISGYVLEYQLAIRLNLAITHANDLGVPSTTTAKSERKNSIGQQQQQQQNGHRRSLPATVRSTESPSDT
ncbi:tetratricopeptide repeat protein 39c [Lichtheimia corymbifera JMRC:FSU:9682]|uniref:Tetratricopeptide repeat protein 39c n=1 Tax=Lichtheimia corymbifera JMRC:FSU:9682 TaxID=1263082 RepID=A0A068SDS5_9FUNG|nr:tetratricopeptide repeat protein 39c [Lichtheimia corymbifera JMRC:FSU:9682]